MDKVALIRQKKPTESESGKKRGVWEPSRVYTCVMAAVPIPLFVLSSYTVTAPGKNVSLGLGAITYVHMYILAELILTSPNLTTTHTIMMMMMLLGQLSLWKIQLYDSIGLAESKS